MSARLILLVLASFTLIVAILMLSGVAPSTALSDLVLGSMGSASAIRGTLRELTPLLLTGIAVFIALRAGLFNIGAEGQFLVGALAGAWIGLSVGGWPGVLAASIGGAAAGAVWALPAGLIKAYRGGHEVISTIMLNNIALHVTLAIVAGPLKDPDPQQGSVTTATLDPGTRLPDVVSVQNFSLNSSLLVGLLVLVALAFWLKRTVAGFEFSLVGANPTGAQVAGVPHKRVLVRAMAISGAVAGLAGAFQVLAFERSFYQGFSPGYGFDALGVAILAGATPWGIIPSALLFGILNKGMATVQLLGVSKGLSTVLLGLLIIVFAAFRYRRRRTVV